MCCSVLIFEANDVTVGLSVCSFWGTCYQTATATKETDIIDRMYIFTHTYTHIYSAQALLRCVCAQVWTLYLTSILSFLFAADLCTRLFQGVCMHVYLWMINLTSILSFSFAPDLRTGLCQGVCVCVRLWMINLTSILSVPFAAHLRIGRCQNVCVCVCVCVREREKEREIECVCIS